MIAYYSRKGMNYLNGRIVDLQEGNTAVAAGIIQKITGGDIFEIKTVKRYPADYTEATEVALSEKMHNQRPALSAFVDNMARYDVIILGYPNWWGTFPMAVFTFLEAYDLSGKSILPFCTHEGRGLGTSERDIRKLCPDVKIVPGLALRGGSVTNSVGTIQTWLDKATR